MGMTCWGSRRPASLVGLVALVTSLLVVVAPPAGAAPSIQQADVCVDPDGTFRFLVDLTEPAADEIVFRLNADDGPFPSEVERFAVNFDAASGAITRDVDPEVQTFGTPPDDRWVDGPVSTYSATPLGGTGEWRVEAALQPGAQAFVAGDTVWGVVVRTFDGADAIARDLVVGACGDAPNLVGALAGPASAEPGEEITPGLDVSVTNDGSAPADSPDGFFFVDLVLSTDETVPPGEAVFTGGFTEDGLLQGGRGSVSTPLAAGDTVAPSGIAGTIPSDTPPGDYFLCIRVDAGDRVVESAEGDNVTCTPITIGSAADTSMTSFDFDIEATDDVPYHLFNVLTPGRVTATLEWTGASDTLDVALTGRRRPGLPDPTAPYATASGTSPLTLTYDVTAADVGRGVGWRLIIDDATTSFDALGTVTLATPFDAALQEDFEFEKISLRSGDLWNNATRTTEMVARAGSSADGAHGIISMERACNCKENETLERAGFHRQSFLPGRHAFGLVEPGANPDAPEVAGLIAGLTPLEPEDKLDPNLLVGNTHDLVVKPLDGPSVNRVVNADGTWNVFVQFADDVGIGDARGVLSGVTGTFEPWSAQVWRADIAPSDVLGLAELDEVEWIEAGPSPIPLSDNDTTRVTTNVDPTQDVRTDASGAIQTGTDGLPIYDGFDGSGVTVAVIDNGVDGGHPDINLVNSTTGPGKHGTHVAGIAAGSGTNSNGTDAAGNANGGTPFQWRGMAPGAAVWDSGSWNGTTALNGITTGSVDVANRSQTISTAGNYSNADRILDQVVNGNVVDGTEGDTVPPRPLVMSAGNNGANNDPQRGQQAGYFSVSKQTKNSVIVGNWNGTLAGGSLSRGSSMGPAYDGRLHPTVVAPGSGITSTGANDTTNNCYGNNRTNGYGPCGGTSMASPAVAGIVALMLDAWNQTYSQPLETTIDDAPPLPATLRAILAQTATDIVDNDVRNGTSSEVDANSDQSDGNDGNGRATATTGPDYATGFGMVDAQMAVNLVTDARLEDGVPVPNQIVQGALAQGNTLEYEFVVTDTTNPFQVTLAWDDEESATQNPATNPMLVNDLDLELVAPDGTVFYPWQLGHTILDANGNPLADNAQPPGTQIQVQVPITAATNTQNFVDAAGGGRTQIATTCANAPAGSSDCESVIQDYVPANALTGNGAWVAGRGKDHLNTLEQVTVPTGQVQAGRWQARVIGFDVQTDLQDFGLVGLPWPDLPELVPSAQDTVALPGFDEPFTIDWTVENVGSADTGTQFNYQVMLSDDFAVGDDVALAAGNVLALSAGASQDVSNSITITQADADALFGTSGISFEDFLARDPFLLVHVDSSDAVIEHDEANIVGVQTGRAVDVVMVYDQSGSMSGQVPISTGVRQKIDVLQDSGDLFYDLLRVGAGDQAGHVEFSTTASRPQDLSPVTSALLTTLGNLLDGLAPDAQTNIRAALELARDAFPSSGDDRRRVLVFFSDGEATTGGNPLDPFFLLTLVARGIEVYSVGYGTPGGSGYSGIDVSLLQALADVTDGGFFRVTDQPVELDKFFVDALAGANDRSTIIDPVETLAPGDELVVDVGVTSEDARVSFIGTWDDPGADVDMTVRSPSGASLGPATVGSYGEQATTVTGPTHAVVEVRLPLGSGPSTDQAGTWQLVLRNDGADDVTVSASAVAASTVEGELLLPEPTDGSRDAGDDVAVETAVRGRAGAPIGDAIVRVTPEVPLVSVGDALAAGGLVQPEIDAVPPDDNGDPRTDVERAVIALRTRLGRDPIPTVEGTPFTLAPDGSGGYGGALPATVAGPYTFTTRASFRTEDCADATRENASSVSVEPTVDPTASGIDLTSTGPGDYELRITPVDTGGGYVGPGHVADIVVTVDGTLEPSSPVIDLLDGRYVQALQATGAGTATVDVEVDGVALPTQVVATGGPVGVAVSPGGGFTVEPTTIAIDLGPVGSISDVTGVVLQGPSGTVTATGVTADPSSGRVTAIVPAGLVPGRHDVLLQTPSGTNAPDADGGFLVVGSQDPAVVQALDDALASVADGATAAELLDVLHAVQALPLGQYVTPSARTAATVESLGAVLDRATQVTLTDVTAALALARMDARYFDVGDPVVTSPGDDVTVDLGGEVVATFDSVVSGGTTTVELVPTSTGTVSYDVTTTATFEDSVSLTFPYNENDYSDEDNLQLYHYTEGKWEDTTTSVDTEANLITGSVDSLSPFVIREGSTPPPEPPLPSCRGRVATIVGTAGADELTGTSGPDVIVGLGGNDVIRGLGGDDVVCGGAGDDEIDAGSGDDVVSGGAGQDLLLGGNGDDVVMAGPGSDVVDGGNGDDVLWLGPGDDVATGGDGGDRIDGGAGADEIDGGDGDDLVVGGLGADRIVAGDGVDLVRAGAGDDRVDGDRGDDILYGNAGDDLLYGRDGDDQTHGGGGTDECSGETQTGCEASVRDPNRGRGPK